MKKWWVTVRVGTNNTSPSMTCMICLKATTKAKALAKAKRAFSSQVTFKVEKE